MEGFVVVVVVVFFLEKINRVKCVGHTHIKKLPDMDICVSLMYVFTLPSAIMVSI